MEGLKTGFLLRKLLFQCKGIMVCFLPLLLLMAPLSPTLTPTLWHALNGLLGGPAFAFLLLNVVIATIIGSSKLETEWKGPEKESQERLAMGLFEEGDEKRENGGDSSIIVQSFCFNTSSKHGHHYHHQKGESFQRRICSFNSSSDYQTKHEQVNFPYKKEKKLVSSRARLASRKSDKAGHFPNKPLGKEVQKRQLLSGRLTSFHLETNSESLHKEKPALAVNNFETSADDHLTKEHSTTGHAEDLTDHQQRQAQSPAHAAPAVHPSMDEVWAAIMSSKKSAYVCMASGMHAEEPGRKPNSKKAKQPLPATSTGAPIQAAAALHTQPAADATAATSPRAARAAPKMAGKAPAKAGVGWPVQVGNEEEKGCDQLKELNRRAVQFISQFNRQMRLQREESWQRQKRERHLLPLH